jgi:N utilization substance protein A
VGAASAGRRRDQDLKKNEFAVAFDQICSERNLDKEVVLEAIEVAILTAYKKDHGAAQNVTVKMDPETGQARIYTTKEVVEQVQDERFEISLHEAQRINEDAALGELVMFDNTPKRFGRIAAQTAKQVILQRIREAERDVLFNSYVEREGELINGTVQNIMPQGVTLNLGRTEALLPRSQQIPREYYRLNQRVRAYVLEVRKTNRGPQVIVSRTHRNMLRRLLELEVPEIFNGTVEIKAIAREAGSRSKVAVGAIQAGIDPVGACVGMRGVRIQNVVRELGGEKIDVVEWNPDTSVFITNALSPAKVMNAYLNDDPIGGRTATVIVPDDQLSLAIGKGGQNARLAAKLTGWRIDIKSATEAAAEALQKAKGEEIARVAAIEDKKDILALAEAILMRKEEAPPTAKELRVLREAIDVIETAAAKERVEEGIHIETLGIHIETLGLSTRVYNSLDQAGITTVEEILAKLAEGDEEMLAIKNFGPKSLAELKEKLQRKGLVPVEGETPIEVLGLSTRVHNSLDQAGIATVEEILAKLAEGDAEMLAIKNFGPKSLAELKEKLQAKDFGPVEEVEVVEAVTEEPVEAVEKEVVEMAAPEVEEVAEAAPVEEEVLAEEVEPAKEPTEEEPTLEYEEEEPYEYEEEDELEERRKKEKKRRLIYDEELGKTVARRRRKPGRRREEWEDYY